MLLSRQDILYLIEAGEISIEPFDKSLLGGNSLDVRLGSSILVAENIGKAIYALKPANFWKEVSIEGGFELTSGTLILGSTLEKVRLGKSVAAQIEGRSSVGRLGLMVHVTAGLIHAGFGEKQPSIITLEMYSVNPNPVKIFPGMRIAQLAFFKLSSPVEKAYDEYGRYVGQRKPEPPK